MARIFPAHSTVAMRVGKAIRSRLLTLTVIEQAQIACALGAPRATLKVASGLLQGAVREHLKARLKHWRGERMDAFVVRVYVQVWRQGSGMLLMLRLLWMRRQSERLRTQQH